MLSECMLDNSGVGACIEYEYFIMQSCVMSAVISNWQWSETLANWMRD